MLSFGYDPGRGPGQLQCMVRFATIAEDLLRCEGPRSLLCCALLCCAVCCTLSRLGSYSGFMSISLVVIETSARYSVLLRCSSFIAQCDVGSLPWSRLDLISSYLFSSDTGLLTRSELSFDRCSSHLTSSHALPPHSFFFLLYIYFYENLVCSYFPSSIPLLFIFPPLIFSSFPSNSPASSVST